MRMYKDVQTWNPFVGCNFGCVYCKPSFQRQMKRRKPSGNRGCQDCYNYQPHFHPERLSRIPGSDTIFVCAFGDISFAKLEWVLQILDAIKNHPSKTFYIQSKNPVVFLEWQDMFDIPENLILGTTIETDLSIMLYPSCFPEKYYQEYYYYPNISDAPFPYMRARAMKKLDVRKFVTIEPILNFRPEVFLKMIKEIEPEFIYIGYDNHSVNLPEPMLSKTTGLINKLKFTDVRVKTLRKAWWED